MAWSRASRHERGYGNEWDRLRLYILERDDGICQACLARGIVTQATEVDHIRPKAKGGTDHEGNLAAICRPCHARKTIEDRGGKPRPAFDADGNPDCDW